MEGWRQLQNVPQLKWALMAEGDHLLTESELSFFILDIFIQMVQKYPGRGPQENSCHMIHINDLHAIIT